MRKVAMGLVALVLFIAVGSANGIASTGTDGGVTFTATGPGNAPGKTLHASATFVLSNLDLIVTLDNTGTFDPNDPGDILTAIFFKIKGDPALTPVSAQLGPDSSAIAHPLPMGFDGDVGGEWAYRNNLTKAPLDANEGISRRRGRSPWRRGLPGTTAPRPPPRRHRRPGRPTAVPGIAQRVSLWAVCVRSHLQYFLSSIRSRSLTLFLVVM